MTPRPTVWQLARLAGCLDPDSRTSPGALWLQDVHEAAVDLLQHSEPDAESWPDLTCELADSLIPVHTLERWQVFVDLGAWREEAVNQVDDLTTAAGHALFELAARLLEVLGRPAEPGGS